MTPRRTAAMAFAGALGMLAASSGAQPRTATPVAQRPRSTAPVAQPPSAATARTPSPRAAIPAAPPPRATSGVAAAPLRARPATAPAAATTPSADSPPPDAPEDSAAAESRAELEAILARLRTDNPAVRAAALEQLLALDPTDVAAVRAALLRPLGMSHFAVHAAMVRAINAATGGREGAEYDLLDALQRLSPRGPDVDTATERVALARGLGRIATADAGRAMLAFALEHNRIFRLECLRVIKNSLRDAVVPALIEFRWPTDEQRAFIRQVRESIRRVTPGETVQTRDNALLAEILRAYGTTRQPDAMSVVVSFVNSDRVQVRDAARAAIAQYGRESINVLRQAYENYVGERPNPLWGWERTARELYEANDRRRAQEVTAALDAGLAAARAGRADEMLARFEFVLARHPLYERRGEMVAPLLAHARALEGSDAVRAEQIYRTALRVDPTGPHARAAQAAVLFLEAERALARGVADPELYRAALRVDPGNARAQAQLDAVAQVEVVRARRRRRGLAALGLLVLAAAGAGLLATRKSIPRDGGNEDDRGDGESGAGKTDASERGTSATRTADEAVEAAE